MTPTDCHRLNQLASVQGRPGLPPCSLVTVWRMTKAGEFPTPFKISGRCTVWDAEETEADIERRRAERSEA